jgi:hypothetical protein
MREKWARVLAAALMTGAIGFALAMPAFFGSSPDVSRSLTAPPSSLQRSVHMLASAPSRPAGAEPTVRVAVVRSHSAHTVIPASTPSSRHSTSAGRSKPDTKPAPAPDGRQLANDTPPAAVSPAPSQPAQSAGDGPGKGKGKGKGKGHDKEKNRGKAPEAGQPPVPATTPPPAEESQTPGGEKDHGHGNGNGQGKGHDKGHDE